MSVNSPEQQTELDAQTVIEVLRDKLQASEWRNVVLETQLRELGTRLQATASDKMEIRRLQLRVEELELGAAAEPITTQEP